MSEITGYSIEQISTLTVTGLDAPKFLQGQCTQDINALHVHQATAAAFCTAKGRAITNVWLTKLEREVPTFQLLCHRTSATLLLNHLRKYAAFFRGTQLSCEPDKYRVIGLSNNATEQFCQERTATDAEAFYTQLPDGRKLLWLTESSGQIAALEPLGQLHPENEWAEQDIRNNVLWLNADQVEKWVPQNFSLDLLEGISFKKGCYTGQEVIARLHYKGQSKKRLYAIGWSGSLANLSLYQNGKDVGDIVQQVQLGDRSCALAIIRSDATESALYLDETEQVQIELLH